MRVGCIYYLTKKCDGNFISSYKDYLHCAHSISEGYTHTDEDFIMPFMGGPRELGGWECPPGIDPKNCFKTKAGLSQSDYIRLIIKNSIIKERMRNNK